MNIGYHIHQTKRGPRAYSSQEQTLLWTHLEAIQPSALLFLNNIDWARRAKRLLPNCTVIHRTHYQREGGLWEFLSPQQFYDRHASEGAEGVVVNVLNEPSGYQIIANHQAIAAWCAQVMMLFGRAGIPVVTPNFGVGHPAENAYSDFDELWQAFNDWPLHFVGLHEYWSYKGIQAGNGRVGRYLQLVNHLNAKGWRIPQIIFTEWGLDDLLDGSGLRGWRDSRQELVYAHECREAARQHYEQPYIRGVCLYCWGNSGLPGTAEDWTSHDVSEAYELHHKFEEAIVVTPTAPAPGRYKIYPPVAAMNVRALPGTNQADIGDVTSGEEVEVLAGEAQPAGLYLWVQVQTSTVRGWVALLPNLRFEPITDQPPKSGQWTSNDALEIANALRTAAQSLGLAADRLITLSGRLPKA